MSLVQTLEWFQCKGCGRRHRWSADIAGTEVECACGERVLCPELDVFDDPGAEGTIADAAASVAAMRAGGDDPDHFPSEIVGLEGQPTGLQRKRRRGLWGMTEFQEVVFWLIGAAVGFSLITHAVIVQWWPYIVGTVLWTPFSFIKFWKVKGRWQGNRSLMRAFEEELGHDEGADDAD